MTSQTPDPLEQAHLALLRGQTQKALALLDTLIAAEPDNDEAQSMRATIIAKQAAAMENVRLATLNTLPPRPAGLFTPRPNGSMWTRPLPRPDDALLNSPSVRRWPKPLLLLACLGAGVLVTFLPGRHHHFSYHLSWSVQIGFGLLLGLYLFFRIAFRGR